MRLATSPYGIEAPLSGAAVWWSTPALVANDLDRFASVKPITVKIPGWGAFFARWAR